MLYLPKTSLLLSFLEHEDQKGLTLHKSYEIDYTFESKGNDNRSTIDHFCVSENLYDNVNLYNVTHAGDNLSDHSVVQMSINIQLNHVINEKSCNNPYPLWHNATEENISQYAISLQKGLENIYVPWSAIHCCDLFCDKHQHEIERYHDDIISACLRASCTSIPHSNTQKPKIVPGWNDIVEPIRQQALFWHSIWKQNNSPRVGIIAEIRKRTRAKYHYTLRTVEKNKENICSQKLAEALSGNRNRDFWKEVKKIKQTKSTIPKSVDNVSNPQDISNLFADKYNELYNSVSYDEAEMCKLRADINNSIHSEYASYNSMSSMCSTSDVRMAIKHLKKGKHEGHSGHYTDHLCTR